MTRYHSTNRSMVEKTNEKMNRIGSYFVSLSKKGGKKKSPTLNSMYSKIDSNLCHFLLLSRKDIACVNNGPMFPCWMCFGDRRIKENIGDFISLFHLLVDVQWPYEALLLQLTMWKTVFLSLYIVFIHWQLPSLDSTANLGQQQHCHLTNSHNLFFCTLCALQHTRTQMNKQRTNSSEKKRNMVEHTNKIGYTWNFALISIES